MPEQLRLFDLPEMEESIVTFRPIRRPIWTENKARLIERYLYYFVLITKHGAYIDGFAGPQQPDKPETWAAKLVLESEPRWFQSFFLCDVKSRQAQYLEELKSSQTPRKSKEPKRTVSVYQDNFNSIVGEILKSGKIGTRTATFCLLDQRTFECHWETVRSLALHKRESMKIEIFYFLPTGWLLRSLAGLRDYAVVEKWWGSSDWARIRGMNQHDLAKLFCERFREELSYRTATAWPIYERKSGGRIMYHMIHATDHPEAPNLMSRAYRMAVSKREPPEQFELELEQWRKSGRQEEAL